MSTNNTGPDVFFRLLTHQGRRTLALVVDRNTVWASMLHAKADDPDGQVEEVAALMKYFSEAPLVVDTQRHQQKE